MTKEIKTKSHFWFIVLFYVAVTITGGVATHPSGHKTAGEYHLGSAGAPVTIVMYYSLTCHHCKTFRQEDLPKMITDFVNTGKIRFIMKDYPTDHIAIEAAKVAWCRGAAHYQELSQAIIQNQEKWAFNEDWKKELFHVVRAYGVTEKEFEHALSNKQIEDDILSHTLEAQKRKIHFVPTFVVFAPHYPKEGKIFEGDIPPADLKKIIPAA